MSKGSDEAVCAVDIGTSAVRASLITAAGAVLETARRNRRTGSDHGEFDPVEVLSLVTSAIGEITSRCRASTRIRAVGVAGFVGTVLLDSALVPLRPGSDWSDTRGVDLLAASPVDSVDLVLREAGRPVPLGSALAQLLWLRRYLPDDLADLRWVVSPKDFITARLTGEIATDATSAAYSLLLNVRTRDFGSTALDLAGLTESMLPRPRNGSDIIGYVTNAAAGQTGLPARIPVVAGGPDGTLGAVALLGVTPNVIVDIAGTTDVITTFTGERGSGERGNTVSRCVCNPHPQEGWWSFGGPTGMTGGAADWVSQIVGFSDADMACRVLAGELADVPPGSNGVVVLPFLSGSRFPYWRADERAAVLGLGISHRRADVVRAAQEAGAFAARDGIAEIDPDGQYKILLAGGIARSAELSQLRADVLGRPLDAYSTADTTLRGAAALAVVGVNLHADLASAIEAGPLASRRFEPQLRRSHAYDNAHARWQVARQELASGA